MNQSALSTPDLVVLLAGGLKPSPLASAAGRSVLDLSADGLRSILEHWLEHIGRVADRADRPLDVRVLHGSSLEPARPETVPAHIALRIERETKEFRGPAGVVRDAASDLPESATVLVIEAARWFSGDLLAAVEEHFDGRSHRPAAVSVLANRDRTPAGIVLLERSTLDPVSALGFVDLKEQWLNRVRDMGRTVRVHTLQSGASLALREREDLLAAARSAGSLAAGRLRDRGDDDGCGDLTGPRSLYSESAQGYFAAISPKSIVAPNSAIADSVIMDGATVHAGAVVARSVVCPGAVVGPRQVVIDRVCAAATGDSAVGHRTGPGSRASTRASSGARSGPQQPDSERGMSSR